MYSCAQVELSPISELTVKLGWYPLFVKKGETLVVALGELLNENSARGSSSAQLSCW